MKCRNSAMLLRKRWELQQIYPSGFRRGAPTFTTWLTLTRPAEHDHRTKLGHGIHAMMKRGVAILDHRMHVLAMMKRGVAILDHRMHVLVGRGVAINEENHRIGGGEEWNERQ